MDTQVPYLSSEMLVSERSSGTFADEKVLVIPRVFAKLF
jgi:hypothetical protein